MHLGHYEMVCAVFERQLLDRVIIVPVYQNPLKAHAPTLPEALRWRMLEETFAEFDQVTISAFEIRKKELSYTYRTLEHFRIKYPYARLSLLMGEDALRLFHKWVHPEKILSLAGILAFSRPAPHCSSGGSDTLSGYATKARKIDWAIPPISATEIRAATIEQIKRKPMLHPAAMAIWESHLAKSRYPKKVGADDVAVPCHTKFKNSD